MASVAELDRKAKEVLGTLPESLGVKERMAIEHQEMPSQDAKARRGNMEEVALGYTEDMAVLEAMRCLGCKNRIDIPRFIARIQERDYRGALSVIQEESILPSICGRVCPQESQCQKHCTVGKALKDVDKAVGIGRLERFVADWCSEDESVPEVKGATGRKVAVVGSGPAHGSRASEVHGHSRGEPCWGALGERVPDEEQPDEGVRQGAEPHARVRGQAGCRPRRGERRDGCCEDGAASRSRER